MTASLIDTPATQAAVPLTPRFAPNPQAVFWIAAVVILGGCALNASLGHWANQPNRDLYQHMSALRALIDNLHDPANPFVVSDEGSRHFQPYWVAMAALARTFHWSIERTIGVASFFSVAIIGLGIYLFGRAYYRSPWGPAALLVCALLGWSMPISHTGFLNVPTLVEGASYPAQLLNGLSLILWALVIRTMRAPRYVWFIPPLVALMFATHQLGAGLGLIVATSITLFWPATPGRRKMAILIAFAVGLAVSSAWPYYNPFDAMFRAADATWQGGVEWYTPKYLLGMLLPSIVGLYGLFRPVVPGTGRPVLLALPVLVVGFIGGNFGFLTGTRFAPVAVLLLQVGMAAMLVRFLDDPAKSSDRFKLGLAGTVFGTILFQVLALGVFYYPKEYRDERRYGNVYAEAAAAARDIPDFQQIAAYDVAAWPLTATGQKVLSIPWPEPMITDLADRQRKVELLFDPSLSQANRLALATRFNVRTLILDRRFGLHQKKWRRRDLKTLTSQGSSVREFGPLIRIDLY